MNSTRTGTNSSFKFDYKDNKVLFTAFIMKDSSPSTKSVLTSDRLSHKVIGAHYLWELNRHDYLVCKSCSLQLVRGSRVMGNF